MDSRRQELAKEIKEEILCLSDVVLQKLKNNPLPVPFTLIQSAKNNFLDNADPEVITENLILNSHPIWNDIKLRKEESVIQVVSVLVEKQAPFFSPMFASIKEKFMATRKEILDEKMETQIWSTADSLIRKSIQYSHLKREPKLNKDGFMKYTGRFAVKMSVRSLAEEWGVTLDPKM